MNLTETIIKETSIPDGADETSTIEYALETAQTNLEELVDAHAERLGRDIDIAIERTARAASAAEARGEDGLLAAITRTARVALTLGASIIEITSALAGVGEGAYEWASNHYSNDIEDCEADLDEELRATGGLGYDWKE